MQRIEARRVRHFMIRLEGGEELPRDLLRALDEVEVKAAWVSGTGTFESAELSVLDRDGQRRARRLDVAVDVIDLSGSVTVEQGASVLRLAATLAREGDLGLDVFGGHLIAARARAIELHVTALDDAPITKASSERPVEVASAPVVAAAAAPAPVTIALPAAFSSGGAPPAAATPPVRASAPAAPPMMGGGTPMPTPQRHAASRDEVETYPEPGDQVTHFHFGECTVMSSDGDRIHLRQDRDGRMREVALGMLKIELASLDAATGKRSFRLVRKN